MGEDEWVNDAMKDDLVVVELLMRLKQSEATAKLPVLMMTPSLEWGVRLPRSRQVIRCSINNVQIKKEGESTRASPTTPLSWSGGGTSVSGGCGGGGGGATVGDGFEESSKPVKRPSAASLRSNKVNGTNEPTNRRSRKKKTFAELKEEESLLLKERIHLEKELVALAITRKEQVARNSQLKRLKLDLQHQSAKQTFSANVPNEGICNQSCNREIVHTPMTLPMVGMCEILDVAAVFPSTIPPTDPCSEQKEIETRHSLFELPDLNEPFEEDSGSEVLYGMS